MTSFEELYNTYFKRVYAYIFSRVRNAALAEDLCACTWKKCYEHLNSFNVEKGEFAQWLFTIARNETNMHWRTYWVRNVFSLAETEDDVPETSRQTPLEQLEEANFRADLLRALARLSGKERDLVSLKFYSGLNNRQIAAVTRLSESNVGTVIHRAVQKMRRFMEKV